MENDFIIDLEISSLEEAFINISEKIENKPHKTYKLPASFHDNVELNSWQQIMAMWKANLFNMGKSAGKIFHLLVPSIITLFILSAASIVIKNYMGYERKELNLKEMLMNWFYLLGLIYGQGVVNTFYIENCFDNRSIEIRPILRTSGMRTHNYWIGQFLGDYLLFLCTLCIFVISIFNFNIVALISKFSLVLLILITYGAAMIASFYVYGVLF